MLNVLMHEGAPADAVRLFEHVIAAQEIWLDRVRGRPAASELWAEPQPERWERRLEDVSAQWQEVVMDIADPTSPINYRNSSGTSFTTSFQDIVTHLTIHGQHHRAQVLRELRKVGITPPRMDFIDFVREHPSPS